jgi:hypothetical protein
MFIQDKGASMGGLLSDLLADLIIKSKTEKQLHFIQNGVLLLTGSGKLMIPF